MPTRQDGSGRHRAPRQTRRRAVTAAASLLAEPTVPGQTKGGKRMGWQERTLTLYDLLGEIWYASQFYARSLEGLTFSVSKIGPDGKPLDDAPPPAAQAELDRIQMDAWAAAYGRLMFLTGEGRLCGHLDENGNEIWDFMSVLELAVKDKVYEWDNGYDGKRELRPSENPFGSSIQEGEAVIHRFWNPHPAKSGLADCGLRSNIDTAEELLMLTWATQARTKSRLAGAGLFLIPSEVSPPPLDVDDDGNANPQPDDDPNNDPWLQMLLESAQANIADRDSAGSVVPITIQVMSEYIEKFKLIKFYDENDPYPEAGLRPETVKRLAVGLDMPPEALLGVGDVNHWGAWQIDEQVWKAHVRPVSDRLCADVTRSRIWPVLKGVEDAMDWQVVADPSGILTRPDPGPKAVELHDRNAISDRAVREANGFVEDDAPTDENPNTNPQAKPSATPAPFGGAEPDAQPGTVEPGPPGAAVTGAAVVALHRCREAAGARLRTTLNGGKSPITAALRNRLASVDNANLVAKLGVEGVQQVSIHGDDLVRPTDVAQLRTTLAWLGIDGETAERVQARVLAEARATLLDADYSPSAAWLESLA